ncbi:MAG TPA: Dam family site-specific DNA-(adenine-N6)-methyltransferase [Verrucomicrobiae bacterium]|jgi:DNA adenine methylase|nr:Dam family site-specific DNA-(adenine-N6)-methyltransferase [Verrucomicrobiae bacterium]
MNLPPLVPPIKCQGIKTKLVAEIKRLADSQEFERWVEPFCGSCVVALNVQPKRAVLADSNVHIIRLYQEVQNGALTPALAKAFLIEEGEKLRVGDDSHYYAVRERFNAKPTSLDFLFLNRSCFNGVMRFNRNGKFNVPYGHKPERFAQAYITKITNQIRRIAEVVAACDWTFAAGDFRQTLANARAGDFVYADPPYAGRHVDYFNSWSESDETELGNRLKQLPCPFVLSTWHSNEFRKNAMIEQSWSNPNFHLLTREHYYHVGSTEDLRHPMIEALITNFPTKPARCENNKTEQLAFLEHPVKAYSP